MITEIHGDHGLVDNSYDLSPVCPLNCAIEGVTDNLIVCHADPRISRYIRLPLALVSHVRFLQMATYVTGRSRRLGLRCSERRAVNRMGERPNEGTGGCRAGRQPDRRTGGPTAGGAAGHGDWRTTGSRATAQSDGRVTGRRKGFIDCIL